MRLLDSPRVARLRAGLWPAIQAAVAAGAAWWIARQLLSSPRPLFAPIAALISLGFTTGRRGRQAVQVVIGVAVGIAIADLIERALGTGAPQIGLIVVLAMAATLLVSGSPGAVVQAGVTGLIVASAPRPEGLAAARLLQALIGGGVALVFSQLLFPVDPRRRAREALADLVRGIVEALDEIRDGLEGGAAEPSVDRALALGTRRARLDDTLALAGEALRLTPRGLRHRGELGRYDEARRWLDLVAHEVANVARGAGRLDDEDDRAATRDAVGELAAAARELLPDVAAADRDELVRHAAAAVAALPDPATLGLSAAFVATAVGDVARDLARAGGVSDDNTRFAPERTEEHRETMRQAPR